MRSTLFVFLALCNLIGCGGSRADSTTTSATASATTLATASATASAAATPVVPQPNAAPKIDGQRYFGETRGCFILREIGSGETFEIGGEECAERSLPASTFKIPNAIIALDTGVLKDETTVMKWDGVKRWNANWNRDHALPTSMWHSVVWFYQRIAKEVGADRYRTYLSAFHYGNADPSGDVTMFWLDGPLRISPREQITFLTALYEGKLKVAPRAVDIVKKTLELRGEAKEQVRDRLPFVDKIPDNVVLSGKTGSAWPDTEPLGPTDVVGWFVGAVEREGHKWVFASRIRSNNEKKVGPEAGRIAYEIMQERGML